MYVLADDAYGRSRADPISPEGAKSEILVRLFFQRRLSRLRKRPAVLGDVERRTRALIKEVLGARGRLTGPVPVEGSALGDG